MCRSSVAVVVAVIFGVHCSAVSIRAQEKSAAKADGVNLLDGKKVVEYLSLGKTQKETVITKIAQIQEIVDEDKKVREDMRARFMSGEGRPGPETFQALRAE